ncbi:Cell division protein FtsZ 1 [uncultured archaeon]|nr:Cell division protein FtsZ 1 [uncultured archaeon]
MASEDGALKIVLVGCGGAGCNTVKRLADMGAGGAQMLALNTDKKHLNTLPKDVEHVLIGPPLTRGLGAGGDPLMGEKAAIASKKAIAPYLKDADLVFVTAGMGGGTGTGSAPVVAQMAKDQGALVIGMVSIPFALERVRVKKAQKGTAKLAEACDCLVVIENDKLYQWVPNMQIEKAFALADEVVAKAVSGISRTILEPSLMNLDFADLKSLMEGGGLAMIALGDASGYTRCEDIVPNVLGNPLLDVDYSQASGALLHLTGGPDFNLGDANLVGEKLTERVGDECNVVWGSRVNADFEKRLEAFVIFTGIPSPLLLDPDAKMKE